MQLAQATRTRPADLAQNIERQIVQRTWGRIHRLEVEVVEDRVVVHGCTSSYYSKQLALEGVLDVIGLSGTRDVDLDIKVAASPPSSTSSGRANPVWSALA